VKRKSAELALLIAITTSLLFLFLPLPLFWLAHGILALLLFFPVLCSWRRLPTLV
jgi:hypothetical protein